MGKRKQTAPQRASEDKRLCLEWNMLDGVAPEGSLSVLDDSDPSILHEAQQVQEPDRKTGGNSTEINSIQQPQFPTQQMQDMFDDNLKYCSYMVRVMPSLPFRENEWHTVLGLFSVKLLPGLMGEPGTCVLRGQEEVWLYVSEVTGKSMLYIEEGENDENPSRARLLTSWCVDIDIPTEVLAVFDKCNSKMVVVTIGQYDPTTFRFSLTIHAREALLCKPKFPSEHIKMRKQNILLKVVMAHFFRLAPPVYDQENSSRKHDIENLYTVVKATHDKEEITADVEVQHPSLIPHLRPYQRRGVSWMLSREGFKVKKCQPTDNILSNTEAPLHMLYEEVKTPDGCTLYYNKYLSSLTRERQERVVAPPGGILADEMGLGKTVEVLACILLHKSPHIEQPPRLPTLKVYIYTLYLFCNSYETTAGCVNTPSVRQRNLPTIVCGREEAASEGSVTDVDTRNVMDKGNSLATVTYSTQTTPQDEDPPPNVIDMDMTGPMVNGKVDEIPHGCVDNKETKSDIIKEGDEIPCGCVNNEQTKDNITQEDDEIPHGCVDNKETKSDIIKEGDETPCACVDNEETKDNITQEGDEISGGCVDNEDTRAEISHLADGPLMEAGSQSARRVVKKRKRKNWTKKKKPRQASTLSSMHADDSGVEDATREGVAENSETVGVCNKGKPQVEQCNKGKPQVEQIQKQKKAKAKSTKMKPTPPDKCVKEKSNGVKGSRVKKDESKPKKKRVPSRFVELVEASSFKPKYQFSVSTPVRRQHFFECICGATSAGAISKRHSVQCVDCGLQQHAECVNYDLDDPLRGNFRCPHCHVSTPPIKSGTTLIISPSSISHQWVDEILKHISSQSLKVFVYTGVNKLGFIQPRTLAQQDIVITTYETLRKEIDYVDLPHSNSDTTRKFRHPKRFMAIPSPMTAVEWWRVCLDEAQMVEVTTSKTAEMALRLSAVNRWCVTGTPIQKSVSDVYGLLLFLGLDPYWVKHWWTTLLYDPFCHADPQPFHNVISSVLWRNAKKDVIDQINIPDQSQHVHWLTFSPVEDHFYRRQYSDCATAARRSYSKWSDMNTKLSSLDRHTVSQLLSPLLKLRQACCHPQAVRGEFIPLQKSIMTMEELLESLTKKAQLECEESHRQLVAAINGIAGIHIIRNEYTEAVDMYREVLWSVEEHKDYLRTDKLQLLHTLYNLNEILSLKPDGVAPTLRDSLLKQQADDLRENYMSKAEAKVTSSQSSLTPTQQSMTQFRAELSDGLEWWLEVIKFAEDRRTDETLVEMVKSELMSDYVDNHTNPHVSMARLFHGSRGLELTLHARLVELESTHEKLLQGIGQLCEPLTRDMMNLSVECCLRPVGQILKSCQLCLVDKLFEDYESKLFSITQKPMATVEGDHTNTTRRQGTWADSELEKSLKVILSFAKIYRVGLHLIEFGTTHIKLMDTLKKEFKNLRSVWIAKHEQYQALDELDMATTRLRLRLPDEELPDTTQLHVLQPAELAQQKLKLRTELTVAKNELRKKVGQLFYLKNLSKNQIGNEDGVNPEPCPICQRELGVEWSVVQCGHCYCIECIRVMVVQYSFGSQNKRLKCAVCRQLNFISDISYVSTKVTPVDNGTESIRVMGSYSIKIESVVRCMLGIKKTDPTAKVLVFSTWKSVLGIIAEALEENNITHRTLYTGKFQNQLTSFREEKDVTALLLPIQSGSNGLNLIEATYVLLVEPILNPAQELQAIGRVHRIGQTRKTEVHRFLIRGTIEEKMYSMLKTIEDVPSSHNTEENVLTIGHLTSLFREEEVNREADNSTNTEDSQEVLVDDVAATEEVTSQSVGDTGNIQGTSGQGQSDDLSGEATVQSNNTSGEVCVIEDSSSEQECMLSSGGEPPGSDVMYCDPYTFSSNESISQSEDSNEGPVIEADCEPINITSPGKVSNSDVIDVESELVEEAMVVDDDWESHIIDLTSSGEPSGMYKDPQITSQGHQQKTIQVDTQAVVDLTSDDDEIGSSGHSQVEKTWCADINEASLLGLPTGHGDISKTGPKTGLCDDPFTGLRTDPQPDLGSGSSGKPQAGPQSGLSEEKECGSLVGHMVDPHEIMSTKETL
ncbi:E3 ubiquitin-protein ligase SHPRH [Mizuhopecten yessoensis]|uniref:E3 ubiquitin-protein ligase SHPRH n=1 Tax=Mizuhopecten yessoensis TaxID=6573 RepID=A0A210PIL4_MIZYE|nr:E3 ubiquitin-protein ligase SHPRH [Mizuhopecten yessoensis]